MTCLDEKIQRFFRNSVIVMGGLLKWRIQRFFKNSFIIMGDLLMWKNIRDFSEMVSL
jgi:hypothetical protein